MLLFDTRMIQHPDCGCAHFCGISSVKAWGCTRLRSLRRKRWWFSASQLCAILPKEARRIRSRNRWTEQVPTNERLEEREFIRLIRMRTTGALRPRFRSDDATDVPNRHWRPGSRRKSDDQSNTKKLDDVVRTVSNHVPLVHNSLFVKLLSFDVQEM